MSNTIIVDTKEPLVPGMVQVSPIYHRFVMPKYIEDAIRAEPYRFGFGLFSETVFYRTYSREINGVKEQFPDVVIRNVNGIMSIRKNFYILNGLGWNDEEFYELALNIGLTFMKMQALPPGRGIYVCGTEFSYTRGGASFNNCGFCTTRDGLLLPVTWTMDSLMCGCGIGFDTRLDPDTPLYLPGCKTCRYLCETGCSCNTTTYVVHDSREGWVKSLYLLVQSYVEPDRDVVWFDYSEIRPIGSKLHGFGGISSGPEPLKLLHKRIRAFMECFQDSKNEDDEGESFESILNMCRYLEESDFTINSILKIKEEYMRMKDLSRADGLYTDFDNNGYLHLKTYGMPRLITDIFNAIGACVVAGNIRRSSEIALGSGHEFLNLKNYELCPERGVLGWMSNNTVVMETRDDFLQIPEIAERIIKNGEPGIFNQVNVREWGRVGKRNQIGREAEYDQAIGLNPCLTGDTVIDTDEGKKTIFELVGIQFNALIGCKLHPSTEQGFWFTGAKQVFEIILENGQAVKATANHQFLEQNQDGTKRWIKVSDIIVGTTCLCVQPEHMDVDGKMVSVESSSMVQEVIPISSPQDVFDCTIPGVHKFLANGIVSHNCGEIPLESYEYCNLAEIFPGRCEGFEEIANAARVATFYASTISLLPTHWKPSNIIIARNRRIGVSISGIADFHDMHGRAQLRDTLKRLYRVVSDENIRLADEAGVPESKRKTTVKPSGTISQIVGVSPGIHFPTHQYAIRTIRIAANSELVPILHEAGVKSEPDLFTPNTLVFSFPIYQGTTRPATEVSIYEQISLQQLLQQEWADNSVSVTLYFNPETEKDKLADALAEACPNIKCLSCLPHSDGVYAQAPYQSSDKETYDRMVSEISPIDWTKTKEEAELPKGCDGDSCDFRTYQASKKNDEA